MKNNFKLMKDTIVKESAGLFLHNGFQGTTIKDITDAVDLTKGAFYWYFKSQGRAFGGDPGGMGKNASTGRSPATRRFRAISS